MPPFALALSLTLSLAATTRSTDAGPSDGGAKQRDGGAVDAGLPPAEWRLGQRAGPGTAARAQLIALFTQDAGAKGGVGETPLTDAEAQALLDDPRAQLVYGERTVQIVAPSMLKKQRQDHLDLMKLFLAPERVDAGAVFVRQHQALLDQTETSTRVEREAIVGILMWESKLGTITGDYRAFNVFTSQLLFIDDANAVALANATEAQALPEASQRARVERIRERALKNLGALVRQCKTRGMDPLEVKGSWAGALGFPQFMPQSLQWAQDGDGDGKIDLFDMDDSIASIGRYLAAHGYADDRQRAVWGYNHEAAYVQGVLAFADALKLAFGRAADAGVDSSAGKKTAPAAAQP